MQIPRLILLVAFGVASCLVVCAVLYARLTEDELIAGSGELLFAWVSDCSPYQDWQSLFLIWSIYEHQGPRTPILRMISGCSPSERREQQQRHRALFPGGPGAPGPPELVFTPAHVRDETLNDTYPPYNRPSSVLQWVEQEGSRVSEDAWVVILDPDMLMLSPLELPSAGGLQEDVIYRRTAPLAEAQRFPAFGQRYEYLAKRWGKAALRLEEICDADAEGCLSLTEHEVAEFFSVGPPWIVRFKDLRRAAPLWKAYTPRIRKQYKQLIAEMYAYSLAFASIGIRHALFDHFVVSYPNAPFDEQAWLWIEENNNSDSCRPSGLPSRKRIPNFLHYCEIYSVEGWYFQKRRVPHGDVLSCDAPLFALPPADLLSRRRAAADDSNYGRATIRQAWFLCALLSTMNKAAVELRAGLCPSGFNTTQALKVPFPKDAFSEALQEFFKN